MRYDCIIVGTGPAGIFAALELSNGLPGAKILLIDRGRDLHERDRTDIFSGWGGAGTFSDGKLNLSGEVGGLLGEYVERDELAGLIRYADSIFVKFGAPDDVKGFNRNKNEENEILDIEMAASLAGLTLIPFPIRHIGTDRCLGLLKNLRSELQGRVEARFSGDVKEIIVDDEKKARGVRLSDGEEIGSDFVVLCPGRVGARWLQGVAAGLGLSTELNPVDIGVRVEVPASALKRATDALHEAKLTYRSKRFNDHIRTFCMNPYGVVVKERHSGFSTVNGHSFSTKKSENTNFAILVSTTFTEPFHEPNAYGEYIASLANLLGNGIILQSLGDLRQGRRSTHERIKACKTQPTLLEATPGDLSFVLPYRYVSDILEMLEALDKFAPGLNSPDTLLYGVEVKFYSMRLKLKRTLETEVQNLFAAGDGAGVTRGIMHAAISGVIAARGVIEKAVDK
ncbi:MAG: FAD-dependent protein [Deltaproteobacteria bacterium]